MARCREENWARTQKDHHKKACQHSQGGRMQGKHQHFAGRTRAYERRDDRTFKRNQPTHNEATQGSVATPTSQRCPTYSRTTRKQSRDVKISDRMISVGVMYQLLPRQMLEKDDHNQRAATSSSSQIPSQFAEEAIFAAASFWTVEAAFGRVDGVLKTSTGYFGGTLRKPTYREVQNVSNANTGHTEAVKIVYDKRSVSFTSLCEVFWDAHDPTSKEFLSFFIPIDMKRGGYQQFGLTTHLRSAIFYANEGERKEAMQSKVRRQMKLNRKIVTAILPGHSLEFFLAENFHQKYYLQKRHIRLCECLNLRSTEQFVDSHVACKLNGYLGGDPANVDEHKEEQQRLTDGNDISLDAKNMLESILHSLSGS
ncbi:Peptide methionine sulfoxide reductase [Nymphaea thermarum]|nr:Peptide methionine sulfoxide reductase [Nymphaea thermarum]